MITFTKTNLMALTIALVISVAPHSVQGEEGHGSGEEGHAEAGHAEGESPAEEDGRGPESVTIAAEAAQASEIEVAGAGPGMLREEITLPGRIALQSSARAELHAPYAGPVRAVLKDIGDPVQEGEVLAQVENAESLQVYPITSPIAGFVLERQTNIGDVTSDAPLFVIGDPLRLQAELNVSMRDAARVAAGQSVSIIGLDGQVQGEASIASILPAADAHSQTLTARAPFEVAQGSALRPGMAIRGLVVLTETQAAIVVPAKAVQTIEGESVVFVRVDATTYEARPVTIGRASSSIVEITSGLNPGESYVSRNAFLAKAEMSKGEAGHGH